MTITDEQFAEMMTRHAAALRDVLGTHTWKLNRWRREQLVERALLIARAHCEQFNPCEKALTQWFDECIRRAEQQLAEARRARRGGAL